MATTSTIGRIATATAATVAVSLVAAGCGSADAEADVDDARVAAATVRIRADGCGPRTELGTGTVIGDGIVATAAHVVAGADEVTLVDSTGDLTIADVVLFDPDLDVAALRPRSAIASTEVAAELRTERGAAGEAGRLALLAADGSIELRDVTVLQRVTIETTDISRSHDVERQGLRIDADIEPGDSGAMVHLPGGGVGIVWSRSTAADGQAWTVDLPAVIVEASDRRSLDSAVDTGDCT